MKKRYVIPAIVIVLGVAGIGLSLHHAPVKPVAAQLHFKDQPSNEPTPETADTSLATPTMQADQTVVDNSAAAPATTDTSTAPLTADQQVLQDTGSQIQVTCFDQIMTYRYGDSLSSDQKLQKVKDIEDAQYISFCEALNQVKHFPPLSTLPIPGFKP
jgi:glucuronate isomerase